jgi:16S rRNA C967 or C1407 C5-methylase (RsmB/RsmF family)
MAASALLAVKPGGLVVYSTCALSPLENDAVMERLFKKKADMLELLPARAPWGESTERGWQIWPDQAEGRGPIYFARFRKRKTQGGGE